MAKNIRWQIPFVSIQGVHYRVDIYDEQDGSWSGITELQAGEKPFVTNEDASEDFSIPSEPKPARCKFARCCPVRPTNISPWTTCSLRTTSLAPSV